MYPKYLFTKENLQKQFQDNSTTYSPEELKKIQKQFIDRVKSVEHQYPLSYIVSDDEKQTSMKYEKWYDRNREYLMMMINMMFTKAWICFKVFNKPR